MTAWTAIWAPDQARLHWQLTVTDERGNVAMGPERSHALYASPRPADGLLVSMGLCPVGEWEPGERGSLSCPVMTTSQAREDALLSALPASGRSLP